MKDIYELKLEKVGELDYDGPDVIETSEDIYNIVKAYGITNKTQEYSLLLTFEECRELTGIFEISRGSTKDVSIFTDEVIKRALLMNTADIVIVHNHLSGDPRPSKNDIVATRDLMAVCDMMDIIFMDHIITCREGGTYYSMRDEGYLD